MNKAVSDKLDLSMRMKQRRLFLKSKKNKTSSLSLIKSTSSSNLPNNKSQNELDLTSSKSDQMCIYKIGSDIQTVPRQKGKWQIQVEEKLDKLKFLRDKMMSPDELVFINYRLTDAENEMLLHNNETKKKIMNLYE